MSLSVSNIVRVTINLSPLAAAVRSFGILMIAGDSSVISGLERLRTYSNIDEVAADFGVNAPEYKAAVLYFGQTPSPATLMIGRWIRTATPAENIGGILSPANQVLTNWTNITNGGFVISIDGAVQTLTGLNFTGATNLNGVASIITAALMGGATCVWDGNEFTIISGTQGAGVKATGSLTVVTNPSPADTLTIDGTVVTFVASGPTGNQVLIGGTAALTAANLQQFLQNSVDVNISKATYVRTGSVIAITFKVIGLTGNSFTLVSSAGHVTVSGSTLSGGAVPSSVGFATAGTGTDISAQLKLTSSTSQALVIGYDAETPAACAAALALKSTAWYGLMFQASVQPTDDQSIDVSDFIEAQDITRIYGVTITDTGVLSDLVTTDLASRMSDAGYLRSFCQYSGNLYAIASFFGRAFTVDFLAQNTTITLMFKQEPGVVGEDLDTNQALTLKNKRCNVFVDYVNDTTLIQYGVMSGSAYFDEIHGTDWLQNAIQTACFNVLYTAPKVPQTDAGVNQLTNAIDGVCGQAVANGLVAPGTWNGPSFGTIVTGQFLKTGYYIFASSVALQSQSDRDARKAPPIQVAIKLAGAIQEVDILVDVNR